MITIQVVSEFEVEMTRERTRTALRYKKANGERYCNSAPYGWRFINQRIEENSDEQNMIDCIMSWRRSGLSYRAICSELTERGAEPRGACWHPQSVARIVKQAEEKAHV